VDTVDKEYLKKLKTMGNGSIITSINVEIKWKTLLIRLFLHKNSGKLFVFLSLILCYIYVEIARGEHHGKIQ